jgi:hypothetical protein
MELVMKCKFLPALEQSPSLVRGSLTMHFSPYYQPQVALQAFWQTLQKKALTPT